MPVNARQEVTIRQATPEDAAVAGALCYKAFSAISDEHNFPCDLPNQETAIGMLRMMFGHPGFYCVVAESGGRIVGSNCLDERSIIAGVGPITIDPDAQNGGAGRKLMQAVMDRANERGAPGIRLVQAAFHNRSLALYTSLGFDIREPLACLQGRPTERRVAGCAVRAAEAADLEACNRLSHQVHGFDRGRELADGIRQKGAAVVERDGRITGYASSLAFIGYAVAETNLDLQALIASADSFGGPGILFPSRNTTLLRWCLAHGLRIVQPMTLMSLGLYNEPDGAWMPSVTF
ncbi:MAG TPA: GNAT family N-acetyltransferase [Acidobacteriaceae bacterium]|jgi:predicted N-acetyltransferase YhbS|nr:GNAT family N-acetyltransferase [Acidobacteriaceae bacterium]